MGPVWFVMAIMGCDDGGMACQQQRIEPVKYETAAQCQAAMQGALSRSSDIDYPVVSATCLRFDQRFAGNPPAPRRPRS
jgi:hypothetical protein